DAPVTSTPRPSSSFTTDSDITSNDSSVRCDGAKGRWCRTIAPSDRAARLPLLAENRSKQRLASARRVEAEERQADEHRERPVRRNRPPVRELQRHWNGRKQ